MSIPIVVFYEGQWNDCNVYENYSVSGILVDMRVNFNSLVSLICEQLELDKVLGSGPGTSECVSVTLSSLQILYKKVPKAVETLEACDKGNQFAIPILCRMTYLTLRATACMPFTGQEDNVPPDNIEANISVEEDDGEKSSATTFPRKPFITAGQFDNPAYLGH
ncbi:hypothetical protein E5676_scaffold25G00140 [Cucumis melo var. makuwa]|uniref:Uncharacterized protein n=1 Tax=Cucumis melo var. makuwa TaxID=1194695 RepID=A0A5A7U242_CUCMM|nr:hypothetical protein E6C27_scaffold264G00160 [Cucumis melo var. makuwa]TYK10652.1 hypothetical protein E5676_scaffold25G00140 [Cucumis melo var. makuwa]